MSLQPPPLVRRHVHDQVDLGVGRRRRHRARAVHLHGPARGRVVAAVRTAVGLDGPVGIRARLDRAVDRRAVRRPVRRADTGAVRRAGRAGLLDLGRPAPDRDRPPARRRRGGLRPAPKPRGVARSACTPSDGPPGGGRSRASAASRPGCWSRSARRRSSRPTTSAPSTRARCRWPSTSRVPRPPSRCRSCSCSRGTCGRPRRRRAASSTSRPRSGPSCGSSA